MSRDEDIENQAIIANLILENNSYVSINLWYFLPYIKIRVKEYPFNNKKGIIQVFSQIDPIINNYFLFSNHIIDITLRNTEVNGEFLLLKDLIYRLMTFFDARVNTECTETTGYNIQPVTNEIDTIIK
jgi:hypothetical protein